MSNLGTPSNPLRVAIIGAGPAGFYAADYLLKQKQLTTQIDIYDRLPTPFGLVRFGVAPDHQKIKRVTKLYDRILAKENVRFFGNVEIGKHLLVADLRDYYHQIVYTTGAQTDRSLGIPGEDLCGSHAATEFVAWYNGHPDYREREFDFSAETVAVIGVGNVAIDVARILARTHDELATTDIADYALEQLRHSNIKNIIVLGRRGPAQVKFTLTELKEMGELVDADSLALPQEAALDPLSEAAVTAANDRNQKRILDILQAFGQNRPTGKTRQVTFRFLVSPVELIGDDSGRVVAMKIVKNELYQTDKGSLRPRATDQYETIPVGLVFRSIGYRGVPVPDVPFYQNWGVILNEEGRVLNSDTNQPVLGEYTAGWIKRGPSGVIGTNKPDAVETVKHMLTDLQAGLVLQPTRNEIEALIHARQPNVFTYNDWRKVNAIEEQRGAEQNRPRVKLTTVAEMLAAIQANS